jgi:hypothetical protein
MPKQRWRVRLTLLSGYLADPHYEYRGREPVRVGDVITVRCMLEAAPGPHSAEARVVSLDPEGPFPIHATQIA